MKVEVIKKMGRKLEKILTFRLTDTERQLFHLTCKQNNVKAQDILRQFVLKYIKENVVK